MPRPEKTLETAEGELADFAADLRKLREKAGKPGYRELAKRAHYAATTLSEAAAGRKLPTLAVTLAYVEACEGDREEWERRWHEVATETAAQNSPKPDDRSPYMGLAAFQRDDSQWFFGRERLVADLRARLRERRCVVVSGASGSGKSSLLRAGLVPHFDGSAVAFTPGAHPFEECAARLAPDLSPNAVHDELRADPRALHRLALKIAGDGPELLLVVDQFEEVFTLVEDRAERSRFITALLTAAHADNSRVRVVLGLRADFFSRCLDHPELVEVLNDAQLVVGPMTTEELRQAICEPAAKAGCAVEGALLATLVAEGRSVLPLVSHALLETWHRRRGTMLTLTGYQAAGGINGALTQTAETFYSTLDHERQRQAKTLFLRLTALGEGTEDTKQRVPRSDLPVDNAVLEGLAQARLLALDGDTVEIAHESLLHAWPRLRQWLTDDRDGLRTHRHLAEAAAAWDHADRDPGSLYRGARLTSAEDWARRSAVVLTPVERSFLKAGEQAERRVARRRRLRTAIGATLVVVALLTGAIAVQQRENALELGRFGLSRELAVRSAAITDQPVSAALLAVEAFRQAPSAEARGALLSAQSHAFFTMFGERRRSGVTDVALSHDGRSLAIGYSDGLTALWDVSSRLQIASHDLGEDGWTRLAFHPDGRITIAGNDSATVWDHTTGRTSTLRFLGKSVSAVSPDGRTVITAPGVDWNSGAVPLQVHDVLTGRTATPLTAGPRINAVTFSADNTTLAVASYTEVKVWDLRSGQLLTDIRLPGDERQPEIALSPDGKVLAVDELDAGVHLFTVADGSRSAILPQSTVSRSIPLTHLMFRPDGQSLVTFGGLLEGSTIITEWDLAGNRKIAHLLSDSPVRVGAFSSDGLTLATTGSDEQAGVLRLGDSILATSTAGDLDGLAYTGDGRVRTAGPGRVTPWDVTARRQSGSSVVPARRGEGTPFGGEPPVFTRDGRLLAYFTQDESDGGQVALWDVEKSRRTSLVTRLSENGGLALSRDGRTLVTTSPTYVKLWDVETKRIKKILTLPGEAGADVQAPIVVTFAPDEQTLVTASADGRVRLWDVTQDRPTTLLHHNTAVTAVAFGPDGRTLAIGGADTSVLLFDMRTREEIATIKGHEGAITALAFSPDGRTLATAGKDRTLRFWDLDVDRVRDRLCGHVRGRVNSDQWARLMPSLPFEPSCR
ncbi:hypothetical protein AB0M48_27610 [Lentzea sp. NPDC051208]|uniref:nSTAND1 domain-containing NTPase n=1 Tax=Lentzea sp. NPDC051208 TaxID=3154642 RepID=UPI0034192FE0